MRKILFGVLTLLAVSLVACDSGDSKNDSGPVGEMCVSGPPATLAATVKAASCDSTACYANYSIQSPPRRVSWVFIGGNPATTSNTSGVVSFPLPTIFPSTTTWSVTGCSCSASSDANNESCSGTNGLLTWGSASGLTVSALEKIREHGDAALAAFYDYRDRDARSSAWAAYGAMPKGLQDRHWELRAALWRGDTLAAVNLTRDSLMPARRALTLGGEVWERNPVAWDLNGAPVPSRASPPTS